MLIAILLVAISAFIVNGQTKSEFTDSSQATLETLLHEARMKKAEIQVRYETIIPDTLKERVGTLVTAIVSGASSHMTTSDYEDPEDLVDAAKKFANELYEVRIKRVYLRYVPIDEADYNPEYVLCEDLLHSQRKVFDFLNR